MPIGRLTFVSIACTLSAATFGIVTAFVPETSWKGFHVMFVLLAVRIMEGLFGSQFASSHRLLLCGLAAVLHGLVIALLVSPVLLFMPRLGRRAAGLTLATLVILDVVLLVLVFPMRELP